MRRLGLVALAGLILGSCAPVVVQPPISSPPAAPRVTPLATLTTTPTLTLTWDYTGTVTPDSYPVFRAPASGSPLAPSGPFVQIGQSTTTLSYADSTVVVGTAYCYQVAAAKAGAQTSAMSNTACSLIMPAPTNPRLSVLIQDSSPNQSGKVNTMYAGIACPGDCTEDYLPGTPVYLAAIARGNARFLGWGGACSGLGAWCDLIMDGDRFVVARFGRK